jgi:acetolactate synthase-1/3 small subunit
VERELLLIKVSILGPENLHEQMPTAKFDDAVEFSDDVLHQEKEVNWKYTVGKKRDDSFFVP